jgi:CDK-activating kinase assembly factor MAT1
MNKTEDDFETLRDYNDYLEQVEEINWNLILNIDVDATWAKLKKFEAVQKLASEAAAR